MKYHSKFLALLALLICFLLPCSAFADELVETEEVETYDEDEFIEEDENTEEDADSAREPRKYVHDFMVTGHFIDVPGFLIEPWFSLHDDMWKGQANMGISFDYVLRVVDLLEFRASIQWNDFSMQGGYWLQKDYTNNLADWVEQDISSIGIDLEIFGYVQIVPQISFYYGGGVWGGALLGKATSYSINSTCANDYAPGSPLDNCSHSPTGVPVKGLPPVFGFASVTVGFKFVPVEHFVIRTEGGFKGFFYGSLGMGIEF